MISIRNAIIADAEKIARNNILLAKESENYLLDYNTTFKGVKSIIDDKSKGFLIVAEEKDTLVGQMMVTFEWSDWHNKNTWWLQSVYVDKSYRQKGIFSKMLAHVKKKAYENNIEIIRLYVHIDNIKAIKAYEKTKMSKKPYFIYQINVNR